jgi:hypothetical protein
VRPPGAPTNSNRTRRARPPSPPSPRRASVGSPSRCGAAAATEPPPQFAGRGERGEKAFCPQALPRLVLVSSSCRRGRRGGEGSAAETAGASQLLLSFASAPIPPSFQAASKRGTGGSPREGAARRRGRGAPTSTAGTPGTRKGAAASRRGRPWRRRARRERTLRAISSCPLAACDSPCQAPPLLPLGRASPSSLREE